nr:MAG TPA: Protein of unknown function (DUF2746) [Caudoviricetes sp.]
MIPAPASAPIVEILTSQEVVGAVGVLVLALLGLAVAAARWARAWVEGRLGALHTQIEGAAAAAEVAAEQAGAAREGVTNAHGTHLRDDVDELRAGLATVLARMDAAEMARLAEAEARERRDRRAEDQLDGLRDDLRAAAASTERRIGSLDTRVSALEHPPRG